MGYRALIIEDDHAMADVLRRRLIRAGHRITIARHQREAYHLLDGQQFDFVLLDLRLPTHKDDMDPNTEVGFAILDHIRERFSQDELPVIVMTAYEETSQTAVRALKASANDYIQKPFEDSPVPLDDKLAGVTHYLAAGKKPPSSSVAGERRHKHKLVFRRDCVEINGIIIRERFHSLLSLLGSSTFMLNPDTASRDSRAMTGKQIAQALNVQESTVRQLVTRCRKRIIEEHKRLNRPIADQDIIRNSRDWKGYEINFDTCYISGE